MQWIVKQAKWTSSNSFALILGHIRYQYQPIFGFLFLYIHPLSPFPSTWLSSIQRMINWTCDVYCDTMFHPAKAGIIRQINIVFHDETLAHFSVPKWKKWSKKGALLHNLSLRPLKNEGRKLIEFILRSGLFAKLKFSVWIYHKCPKKYFFSTEVL